MNPFSRVVILSRDDFKNSIILRDNRCMLILFYVGNPESIQLAEIWNTVANQSVGPIFGAIDMNREQTLAQEFMKLSSNRSDPLHWAGLRGYPFILVYRDGYPVAFYNGARETQSLVDYSLTLACRGDYIEHVQLAAGEDVVDRKEMAPYSPYIDTKDNKVVKQNSIDYSPTQPVRGFNSEGVVNVTPNEQPVPGTSNVRTENTASLPMEKTTQVPTQKTASLPTQKTSPVPTQKVVPPTPQKTVPTQKTAPVPTQKVAPTTPQKTVPTQKTPPVPKKITKVPPKSL